MNSLFYGGGNKAELELLARKLYLIVSNGDNIIEFEKIRLFLAA